ncbi:homeobox protein 13-like isoform X1 [Vespula squamosa]|uniref:Homeobox protein 13-like isoform X1 n=1 Tax=Vespula squamosa TaxID=30214 RepID=A0ABD2A3E4_VESSQ
MQHQFNNDAEEFEPRITPKPATKVENFAVSSVPEVSLIFDKPSENRNVKSDVSASPSFNKHASYASWREYNFSRTPNYKVDEINNSHKGQYDYAHNPITSIQSISRSNDSCGNGNKILKKDVHVHKREQDHIRSCAPHNYPSNTTYLTSHNSNKDYSDYNERTRLLSNSKQDLNTYNDHHNHNTNIPYTPANKKDLVLQNCMQTQVNVSNAENHPHVHNLTTPNVFSNNKFPSMSHPNYPYPCFDMSTYPFPPFYPMHHHNTDNHETIKNLLQLVNTQSKQIQSLQSQVDNLLKMQKDILMDKKKCVCSNQTVQQNGYIHTGTIDTSNYQTTQNQKVKRNACQSTSVMERNLENSKDIRIRNQPELILSEQHAEKGVMEQQVSIGVMTSFEFTVQNNPIVVDYENLQKDEIQNDVINKQNNKHLQETCETLKRNKNCFARLPVGQLENIVEDSESYLSSSQPQSSNFNVSCSMKDLQEKRNHVDTQNTRSIPVERINGSSQPNKDTFQNSNKLNAQKQTYSQMDYEKQRKKEDMQRLTKDTAFSPYNYEHCVTNDVLNNPKEYTETKDENKCDKSDGFTKTHKHVEDSLVLSGGDFKITEMAPVTPEPSIHVEMQEYSSDEESDKIKRTSKVGWTFYNNVLGQVNQILQNSSTVDTSDPKDVKTRNNVEQDEIENKTILDTVKVATLEQLRKLGISLVDKPESREKNCTRKVEFDSSFYPRLDYQANITRATSGITETNTSMHMKALALKYLSDEQLAELTTQKQGSTSLKQVMLSNMQGTNLSFATMRYLERYQLLPGKNNVQIEDDNVMCLEGSPKTDLKIGNIKHSPITQQYPYAQMSRTNCPSKILDISTLKQMPKLL